MTTVSRWSDHNWLGVPSVVAAIAALVLVVGACAVEDGVHPNPNAGTSGPGSMVLANTAGDDCRASSVGAPEILPVDTPIATAIAISQATFECSAHVTIAPLEQPRLVAAAAVHASETGGPLLLIEDDLPSPELLEELHRLGAAELSVSGAAALNTPAFAPFPVTRISGLAVAASVESREIVEPNRLWLIAEGNDAVLPVVERAAEAAGDRVIIVGASDLRVVGGSSSSLDIDPDTPVTTLGVDDAAMWQLDVLRTGNELPGGGYLIFPDRRFVAAYGHPGIAALGMLGAQSPEQTLQRLMPLIEGYDADGVQVIPTFELIATIADADAGPDGDYSLEATVEQLRPWVETARELGMYVVLDLQPGRTDFLTQAQRYEELLIEPHVGIALDPEWRLKPDQFHLAQIGSVDAEEINTVVDYVAGLVIDNALPQKLFIVHQFNTSMIRSRQRIEHPPQLAILLQMDGHGPLAIKKGSWASLNRGSEASDFWWGWKNFFAFDPELATPDVVLDLDPIPYFVSFQ